MTAWTPDVIERFLAENELFGDLPSAALEGLAAAASVRDYPAGATVFERGDEGNSLYVLLEGQVRVSLQGPQGEEDVSTLDRGNFFGEIAMLTRSHRTATITATAETTLLELEAARVLGLMDRHPALRQRIGRTGAKRSQESMKKLLGE